MPEVAVANLRAAVGLPGAEGLDVSACLRVLADWAGRVAVLTERNLPAFRRRPEHFERSEAYFRLLAMVTVLQRDLGVRYNPAAAGDFSFADARDAFLHGLLTGGRTGTCASMPVLYVAVRRRLGYPVHLALAKGHVFVRWEDGTPGGERLNAEATSRGLVVRTDAEYAAWPRPLSAADRASGRYLRPLAAHEEAAMFLSARGHCWADNGRWAAAADAYAAATAADPAAAEYRHWLGGAAARAAAGRFAVTWSAASFPATAWLLPPRVEVAVPPNTAAVGELKGGC